MPLYHWLAYNYHLEEKLLMKKYVLPTLVSLAISGYAFAEEQAAPTMPPAAPAPEMTAPPVPWFEMMEKQRAQMEQEMAQQRAEMDKQMEEQRAQMQETQKFIDEMRQANNPEERQRAMDKMQQYQQEMRDKFMEESGMPPAGSMMPPGDGMMPPYGMPAREGYGPGYGPGWGGPAYAPGPGYYGNPYNRGFRHPMQQRWAMKKKRCEMMEKRVEKLENQVKQLIEGSK